MLIGVYERQARQDQRAVGTGHAHVVVLLQHARAGDVADRHQRKALVDRRREECVPADETDATGYRAAHRALAIRMRCVDRVPAVPAPVCGAAV